MELTVFIPTRGRTGLSTQITLREMTTLGTIKPVLVCPFEEVLTHRRYTGLDADVWGINVEGIGPTRQHVLENSQTRGVVMLDDDMYFSYRPNPSEPRPLERVKDLMPMFQWISDQLDAGFAHGGISARQGNQNIPRPHADCIRVNNAHFFDRDVFLGEGIRFDALPVMEDFHVTLSLLLRGYPNRVAYHYCWSQRGSGYKGGCSSYRTPELQAEAAEKLHAAFPDYVKVVEKESLSQHGTMAKRKDVNIAWLKAWNDHDINWLRQYKSAEPDLRRR
jgi:hypothetical protein